MKSTKISAGSYVLSNDHGQKATLNLRDGRWILSFKETTKSFSSKTEAKNYAQKLFGKIDSEFSEEVILPLLSEKEIIEEQNIRFDAIHAMARMTFCGKNRSLIISGPAGVGKTYTVSSLCEEFEASGDIRYHFLSGYSRPLGLYALLFKYSQPNDVLIIDDCDSIFRDEIGLNLLKCALDTSKRRMISWNSKADITIEMDDGETVNVPHYFEYQGSVIFLTNLNFDAMVEAQSKMSPHFEALLSRSHYIDCGIRSPREKMIRVKAVCQQTSMLEMNFGITQKDAEEILCFMMENIQRLREISLRSALKIGMLFAGNRQKWKEMARVTCLK